MTAASRWALRGLLAAGFLFLALYRLSDYPTIGFDEGAHLRVPKALVSFGVYADYSSDGFRYFGPTLGVGPTVLLPIAGAFKLFGVGLMQGRLVIVAYLLLAIYLFNRLGRRLEGSMLATVAFAFLVSSPAIGLFENGRQVLGEVPALCLLLGAVLTWFSAWDGPRSRLVLAGVLFGAAVITKYQLLIALVPTFVLAAACNYFYYRKAPARVFVWPGIITIGIFGLWQAFLILYLGPRTSLQNLAELRATTAGAATVFSITLMKRAARELMAFKTFGGCLGIGLLYGGFLSLPRSRKAQHWSVLLLFAVVNLSWYVFASISWLRYAFAGLAISSLFVAKFFVDLVERLAASPDPTTASEVAPTGFPASGLRAATVGWAALIILLGLTSTVFPILRPRENASAAMAAYLNRDVPKTAIIETWEPELGFLTNHNYHYPPTGMLNVAVLHIWRGGPAPRLTYHPLEDAQPPYVLVGPFGRWVDLYPADVLERDYLRMTSIDQYDLYRRQESRTVDHNAP